MNIDKQQFEELELTWKRRLVSKVIARIHLLIVFS